MNVRTEQLIERLQKQTETDGLAWTREHAGQAHTDTKDGQFRFVLRRSEQPPLEALLADVFRMNKVRHVLTVLSPSNGELQLTLDDQARPELAPPLQSLWKAVQDAIDLPLDRRDQILESILRSL